MRRRPQPPTPAAPSPAELFRLRAEVAIVIITAAQDCAKQYAFDAANHLLRQPDYPASPLLNIVTEARRYERAQYNALASYRTLTEIADINDRYDDVNRDLIYDLRRAVERALRQAAVVRPQDMAMLYTATALVREAAEIRKSVFDQLRNQAPALCAAVLRIASYSLDGLADALVRAIQDLSPWTRGHRLDLDPMEGLIKAVFDPFVDDKAILAAMTGQKIN